MVDSLYADASLYAQLHGARRADLPAYLSATSGCTTVLEYGVGVGRVALYLARCGRYVTGVDNSPQMLEVLARAVEQEIAEVRERVRWVCADAQVLMLNRTFDAVICPFNGIAHHVDDDGVDRFFRRARAHLVRDGRLVFDALVAPLGDQRASVEIPWFRYPGDGRVCRATETTTFDAQTQTLTVVLSLRPMEGDLQVMERSLRLRLFSPAWLQERLNRHGFTVDAQTDELGDVILYTCRAV